MHFSAIYSIPRIRILLYTIFACTTCHAVVSLVAFPSASHFSLSQSSRSLSQLPSFTPLITSIIVITFFVFLVNRIVIVIVANHHRRVCHRGYLICRYPPFFLSFIRLFILLCLHPLHASCLPSSAQQGSPHHDGDECDDGERDNDDYDEAHYDTMSMLVSMPVSIMVPGLSHHH